MISDFLRGDSAGGAKRRAKATFVRERLDALDRNLMAGIPSDRRLESGIPEEQRADPLDFVQMAGLTRTMTEPREAVAADAMPEHGSIELGDPFSFYQPGVADVDEAMPAGDMVGDGEPVADEMPATDGPSKSAEAFRDLAEDLAREEALGGMEPLIEAGDADEGEEAATPDDAALDAPPSATPNGGSDTSAVLREARQLLDELEQ